jgi:hypothetical protein
MSRTRSAFQIALRVRRTHWRYVPCGIIGGVSLRVESIHGMVSMRPLNALTRGELGVASRDSD